MQLALPPGLSASLTALGLSASLSGCNVLADAFMEGFNEDAAAYEAHRHASAPESGSPAAPDAPSRETSPATKGAPQAKPTYVKCDPARPEMPCTPDAPAAVAIPTKGS